MADLKDCPFCGSAAEMDMMRSYRNFSTGQMGTAVAIYCNVCPADMSACLEDMPGVPIDDIAEELTEKWNSRQAA